MKNSKTKKIVKKIIMIIILILILLYVGFIVLKLIKNPSSTFLVENGKLYFEENVEGYIIRDEQIVEGQDHKSGIIPIKSEGEKIAKGEPIFRYYSKNEDEINSKIKELDNKISEALGKENNLFKGDIKLLENQIEQKLNDIYKLNDIQKIKEYKKDINSYVTKKAKISGENSKQGSYIRQLIDERNAYERELNNSAEYEIAPKSGVVSYRIDGLENILTGEDFSKINSDMLKKLNLKTSQIVGANSEKGKIIDNFKCYIACTINSDTAKDAKVEDIIKLRMPNGKEIDSEIVYINTEEDGSSLIVFKIENYVEELIPYRKIYFDIIWWSDSGLKIPNSAIIEDNNITYIIRNRAGYLEKVYVKVLRKNNYFSIVTNYKSRRTSRIKCI